MQNYVPKLKKKKKKKEREGKRDREKLILELEDFMNMSTLFSNDMQAFIELGLPLGLFFMTGSGSGHCSSLMFNKEAKSFSQTSMFPGKLAFVIANADSRSSFFICE